jgi:hypothetical protein
MPWPSKVGKKANAGDRLILLMGKALLSRKKNAGC